MTVLANLINGEWVTTQENRPNVNPANTNDIIGYSPISTSEHVEQAIAAANAAFPAWSTSPIQQRSTILNKAGTEILERKEELGRLLAREEGKTLAEAIGEVVRAGDVFKFMAGEVLRMPGQKMDSTRPGVDVEITREAVGVIGMITPWNFPIAIPSWKVAPALAFGNCVVLKPADLVPASAHALADILQRAGLPAGVFNLVMGKGSVVGQAILESQEIDAISFTGSQGVGSQIADIAAKRMIRCQLEMGGKNPLVVLDDADIDVAVEVALNGAFYSTGQRCTASSRLILNAGIHYAFVEKIETRLGDMKVGDPLDAKTTIGPVVDERQLQADMSYIEIAQAEGATLAFGGKRIANDLPGYFLEPTLFIDTNNDMRINREEVFGPVAAVIKVQDYDEALSVANDTVFGLSAGICTTSLKHASHFKRHAQAGMVMVNLPTAGVDPHVPFGGRKASSFGPREQGSYAIEFYTTVKTTYVLP
ncbi:MAG: aldehyde dehydrogenase family protein [Pseudomonadota bacterium]|nr:aldehyde dehydrogenase family protein [Pseudomonadota bacterium]